jgi:phenylpropionate dioxygenase-like ring-hydroxylating dioxygenase large terminal subunit
MMEAAKYLRNCWYGLAWNKELSETSLLSRRILGINVVAFRDKEGRPAALRDRCPHRMAPLSLGNVKDGVVQCGYHGLQFDIAGQCVGNPLGDIPRHRSVESYPTVERDQMIWIWLGDEKRANPDLLPDFDFQNRDGVDGDWVEFGYTHVNADYRLETDNLMDLSHAEFLHAKSFGGRGYFQQGENQLHDFGNEIHSNWWMPNLPYPDPVTREPTGERLDHFLDMRWTAPSALRLHVNFVPHGLYADRKDTLRDDLPGQFSAHIITPEDEGSCHYFWSANKPVGAGPFVGGTDREARRALFRLAFEIEDKPMLEAVQANMEKEFWDEKPIIFANDAGGVRVRRRLAQMISDEQSDNRQAT